MLRVKAPSDDCTFRAVHYKDTPDVHRHMLNDKNAKDELMTRHYFRADSGRLDKAKYSESHSSAIHGNQNQLTTTTSSGYISFVSAAPTPTAASTASQGSEGSRRQRRTLKQAAALLQSNDNHEEGGGGDDEEGMQRLTLEPTGIFFEHGEQDESPLQQRRRQRQRRGSNDQPQRHLSESEARAVAGHER